MRTSTYGPKIVSMLEKAHILSLAEIALRLPKADFSSVFRNVEKLCAERVLRRIVVGKEKELYELASHHHDHFVCDDCGRVEIIEVSVAHRGKRKVSTIVAHGSCEICN